MPLKFESDAAYERWLAATEKREYRAADRLLTTAVHRAVPKSSSSNHARKRDKSRLRHHAGRPVRHVLRGGVRKRSSTVLRTLLGPLW